MERLASATDGRRGNFSAIGALVRRCEGNVRGQVAHLLFARGASEIEERFLGCVSRCSAQKQRRGTLRSE